MISISFSVKFVSKVALYLTENRLQKIIVFTAAFLAVCASTYSYLHGYIVAYGDSESHLNIAKRVIDSLTPGFAQLGGIWLPLPHLLMIPFVYFDFLWRTGLAGSIVNGIAYVITTLYLFKLGQFISGNKWMGLVTALIFATNLNILYLQSTPMTELSLLVFFVLSTYYFIRFIEKQEDTLSLILSAFFGFCAALSRYDGWSLVLAEAGVLVLLFIPWKKMPRRFSDIVNYFDWQKLKKLEGLLIMFSTLAFFGIILWLAWDWLILGDPLYFTHSIFSAKSQQNSWLARGELPAYRNIGVSFLYYFVTSMSNIGVVLFAIALVGFGYFAITKHNKHKYYILLILLVPFAFNVLTLFLGQSVIFIPHITPVTFEWRLFNVRYGVMALPFAAICIGYLFYKLKYAGKLILVALFIFQFVLYGIGYSKVVSLDDGVKGLSSFIAKIPDAQNWFGRNYDEGLILLDDFARAMSIIRTPAPMKNFIYVGNKPYWEESLKRPEKYATWIIMQKDDAVWQALYNDPIKQGNLYKYYIKQYTSNEILIFRRNEEVLIE